MQHKSLVQKLKHPEHVVAAICRKLYFLFPGDCFYLKLIYYLEMGKKLRLKNPKAFSEKLQWLKHMIVTRNTRKWLTRYQPKDTWPQ